MTKGKYLWTVLALLSMSMCASTGRADCTDGTEKTLQESAKNGDEERNNNLSPRQNRARRWIINFKFDSAEELAKQLANIEAYLLVPRTKPGEYLIYKDLSERPPKAEEINQERMKKNNRIWYSSNDKDNCQTIAAAFKLGVVPTYFAIFIPNALEIELHRAEMSHKGLTDEEVAKQKLETRFNISKSKDKWEVNVVEQRKRD